MIDLEHIMDYLNEMAKNQNRIERMLKFLICRMPYVTFNDMRIEDAPDIGDIFIKEEK